MLISWQGTGPGGLSGGTGNLSNDHFQPIATAGAGNGHRAEGRLLLHAEFPAGVHADRGYRVPWYPSDG